MVDIDNDQIYESSTGKTINDIENITEDQLKEILEIKKESCKSNHKINKKIVSLILIQNEK